MYAGHSVPSNPDVSPESITHLPQSRLLPLLMRRAHDEPRLIRLLMGHTVTGWVMAGIYAAEGERGMYLPSG